VTRLPSIDSDEPPKRARKAQLSRNFATVLCQEKRPDGPAITSGHGARVQAYYDGSHRGALVSRAVAEEAASRWAIADGSQAAPEPRPHRATLDRAPPPDPAHAPTHPTKTNRYSPALSGGRNRAVSPPVDLPANAAHQTGTVNLSRGHCAHPHHAFPMSILS